MKTLAETQRDIRTGSRSGWPTFLESLEANTTPNLVDVAWEVVYDPLGHDVIVDAKVATLPAEAWLLQVWVMVVHPGFWIPQFRPWVSSVVEFDAKQRTRKAHCGLFDSKWRPEDVGVEYQAVTWGYVEQDGEPVQFGPFVKMFIFPG
jgi:hypothetical protein